MRKNFEQWHIEKSTIHNEKKRPFFHEREVWWCSLGENIGFEQDGKGEKFSRPVLIFKKFNNEIFWAIPATSKVKAGKFYVPLVLKDGEPRVLILSQLKLTDAKRLVRKIETLSKEKYKEIQKSVINLCGS